MKCRFGDGCYIVESDVLLVLGKLLDDSGFKFGFLVLTCGSVFSQPAGLRDFFCICSHPEILSSIRTAHSSRKSPSLIHSPPPPFLFFNPTITCMHPHLHQLSVN